MPYPILIARKQKRPSLPFTEEHQRHRHICSSAYLGSGVHFLCNSPAHPHWIMLGFFVKGMNRICFYWKQSLMGCSKNTDNVFKPLTGFQPLGQSQSRYQVQNPRAQSVSPQLSCIAPWTHTPTCRHCNKLTLGFPGFNYTDNIV